MLLVLLNAYLPIFFNSILGIPNEEVAFAQFIGYSALFSKPLFAIFSDVKEEKENKKPKRKAYIMFGSLGLIVSFFFMIISIPAMIAFGIFWSANFFALSIIDIAIDGNIIDTSPDNQSKEKKVTLVNIGNVFGNVFSSLLYLLLISPDNNLNEWSLFLYIEMFSLIPLIFLSLWIVEGSVEKKQIEDEEEDVGLRKIDDSYFWYNFVLMALFVFLYFSEELVNYSSENWILYQYGQGGLDIWVIGLMIGPFIAVVGYLAKSTLLKKTDRIKLLIVCMIFIGIDDILTPFIGLWGIFILSAFMLIPRSISYITFISLMMDFSKDKRSYKFQILAAMAVVGKVVFIPLGTLVSGLIGLENTGILLLIIGILIFCSIIPIVLMKMK